MSEEESGVDASRLYGICVLHPRILKTPITINNNNSSSSNHGSRGSSSSSSSSDGVDSNNTNGAIASNEQKNYDNEYIDFESTVCYAFITR